MANIVKTSDLHRIVLTAIIYNDEGKYLITKRGPNKKVYPNKWTVPGGGVEAEDYVNSPKTVGNSWTRIVERTLIREIKEEVNLEIEKIELLLDLIFIRPDNVPVLTLSYYAKLKSGVVKLEEEDTDFAWVTVDEVKKYDLIEGIYGQIEEVNEILKDRNRISN